MISAELWTIIGIKIIRICIFRVKGDCHTYVHGLLWCYFNYTIAIDLYGFDPTPMQMAFAIFPNHDLSYFDEGIC